MSRYYSKKLSVKVKKENLAGLFRYVPSLKGGLMGVPVICISMVG